MSAETFNEQLETMINQRASRNLKPRELWINPENAKLYFGLVATVVDREETRMRYTIDEDGQRFIETIDIQITPLEVYGVRIVLVPSLPQYTLYVGDFR